MIDVPGLNAMLAQYDQAYRDAYVMGWLTAASEVSNLCLRRQMSPGRNMDQMLECMAIHNESNLHLQTVGYEISKTRDRAHRQPRR